MVDREDKMSYIVNYYIEVENHDDHIKLESAMRNAGFAFIEDANLTSLKALLNFRPRDPIPSTLEDVELTLDPNK